MHTEFSFTSEDLQFNREGKLSPKQIEQFKQRHHSSKRFLFAALGVFALTLIAAWLFGERFPMLYGVSFLIGILAGLFGAVGYSTYFNPTSNPETVKVLSTTGPVTIITQTDPDYFTRYYTQINGLKFLTFGHPTDTFIAGNTYTFYYVQGMQGFLSYEPA
jgi:hypothetical protein